jgi:signal transduction histidine kinase
MYDPTGISSSILGYILYTLCFYVHPLEVMPILLLVLIIFYKNISQFWIRQDVNVGYVYELFSFVLFYLFGFIIRMDDRTRLLNRKMIYQLEEYASNSINLGKQEERNRISRDLHDNLGHQLVAVNIQLQKAIAYREIDTEESLRSMNTALNATNGAMGELRETIKNLREFEVINSIEEELETLVQHVRENGIEIHYSLSGKSKGFSELSLYTLKQIVQEGLTNIEKHSQATQAELSIVFQTKKILVKIIDNGVGFHPQQSFKQNHFGLLGMRERLELIGGSIKINSKPDQGTTLIIEIPKKYPAY